MLFLTRRRNRYAFSAGKKQIKMILVWETMTIKIKRRLLLICEKNNSTTPKRIFCANQLFPSFVVPYKKKPIYKHLQPERNIKMILIWESMINMKTYKYPLQVFWSFSIFSSFLFIQSSTDKNSPITRNSNPKSAHSFTYTRYAGISYCSPARYHFRSR